MLEVRIFPGEPFLKSSLREPQVDRLDPLSPNCIAQHIKGLAESNAKLAGLPCADLELDRHQRHAKRRKETIPLTSKEFAILELFLLHADDLVTRSDILEHVWEHHSDTGSNLVDVNRVRRKVDQNGFLKLIHTVRGTGYRLGMAEE